ncbi:hypothetical protein [Terrisporobacter petrolearius]|uniref:hypothetical protein n=1 Tax=Terrisporobacter petrolearius TaxID=1460447 RepID=UPI0031CC9CB1
MGSGTHDGNKVLIADTYDTDFKQFGVKVQVEINAAPYALAAIALIILGLISGEIVAGGLVISEAIATVSGWVVAILEYYKLVIS